MADNREKEQYERKTEDLLSGSAFVHRSYDRGKTIVGTISGEVKKSTITKKDDGTKIYTAAFDLKPLQAKVPAISVDIRSMEPIDMSPFEHGALLAVTGQRFLVTPRDKDGHTAGERRPVLFARSVHSAVLGENNRPEIIETVIPADKMTKTEFYRAANELLTGYVFNSRYSIFNERISYMTDRGEAGLYGYVSRFSVSSPKYVEGKRAVDEDGRAEYEYTKVDMVTKEPIDVQSFISTKEHPQRLSLKGAYRLFDYKDANGKWHNNIVTFEPVILSKYIKKEAELKEHNDQQVQSKAIGR